MISGSYASKSHQKPPFSYLPLQIMLSLEKVGKIMGNSGYSDEELLKIRDDFYNLGEIILDSFQQKNDSLHDKPSSRYNTDVDPVDN